MAWLSSCWLLIEYVFIPDGDEKWFRLNFFIHPQIFILCQVFSWIRVLGERLLAVLFLPFRIVWFVSKRLLAVLFLPFRIVRFVSKRLLAVLFLPFRIVWFVSKRLLAVLFLPFRIVWFVSSQVSKFLPKSAQVERNWFEMKESIKEEPVVHVNVVMSENKFLMCLQGPVDAENERELGVNLYEDMDMNELSSCFWSSESYDMEAETEKEKENDQSDPFFAKYIERMKWFDLLNYERSCGISAILKKQLGNPGSFESTEASDFSIPLLSWSKMDRRKLLRSLENDFEMVYVGQSCLCWEALHHQYRKVEALACSDSQNGGAFYGNVAGEFQKFQVLLERFMENEVTQGKRFWNYVQGRFSLKSLLQVPEVSGYFEGEKEAREGEAMGAREVLETIEKSIMTFSIFISTDNKKSWWKFKSSMWSHPPVEDPKDLELLFDLKRRLQKKELYLKDLQRKKKCWLKRAKLVEHYQRREIFFSMIDMKLVSRVLQMSIISTPQLKWCQEKLNSIDFTEGKVTRAWTNCLFPPS